VCSWLGGLFKFIVSRVGVDLFRCFVEAFGGGRTCLVNSCPTEEMCLFWITKGNKSNMIVYILIYKLCFAGQCEYLFLVAQSARNSVIHFGTNRLVKSWHKHIPSHSV